MGLLGQFFDATFGSLANINRDVAQNNILAEKHRLGFDKDYENPLAMRARQREVFKQVDHLHWPRPKNVTLMEEVEYVKEAIPYLIAEDEYCERYNNGKQIKEYLSKIRGGGHIFEPPGKYNKAFVRKYESGLYIDEDVLKEDVEKPEER